jgi:Phage tail tube protein
MAAYKVGGVAFIKVDGTQFLLRGDLTITPDLYKRTGIAGQDGIHGYTEEPSLPQIKATLTDTGGLSLEAFQQMTQVTVTAELNNGKVYVLRDAFTTDARVLNTADGSIAVTWQGMACEELLAA